MYLANRTPSRTLSEGRVPARCVCRPALCRRGRRLLTRAEQRATAVGSESPELRPGETPEQALQRRLKESEEVEERVEYLGSLAEFQKALEAAGNRLVVLEVQSDNECQTGIPEAEVHWKHDAEAYKQMLMEQCRKVKHTFARTARECPDSIFYSVQADDEEVEELLDFCGVDLVPTVQFWRNSEKLWEHQGVPELEQDIGSGVMFYSMEGDEVCGMKTGTFVRDLHTRREVMDFIDSVPDDHLAVLDVSLPGASGCVRIWPAVIALARNFQGHVEFARLLGNGTQEISKVMQELNILEVPSFLFFKAGCEVERHVGSSRGDLIGHILEVSARCGMAPPPPPPKQARPRRRSGRYRARQHAETVPKSSSI